MAASSSQPANEELGLFYRCVEHIFSNWTALKYAVQMGMGGKESSAKAQWLIGTIDLYFRENVDLLEFEVEDLLTDIMNTEFNLIADDGSISEISHRLCQFHRLKEDDKDEELLKFLNTSPRTNPTETQISQNTVSHLENDLQQLRLNPEEQRDVTNGEQTESMETSDPNDGGWQTITRSRRK